MDPTYTSKAPGKDPMGMDLVPVYEGEAKAQEGGVIKIRSLSEILGSKRRWWSGVL